MISARAPTMHPKNPTRRPPRTSSQLAEAPARWDHERENPTAVDPPPKLARITPIDGGSPPRSVCGGPSSVLWEETECFDLFDGNPCSEAP